ncbi:MAG: DUF1405 domain-containing protein [Haloferacaceae archaeon]
MATVESALARLGDRASLPEREALPRWVAPLPDWLEDVGLLLAPLVVLTNLVGTAFGFWYYRFQFAGTRLVAWPLLPDSPLATLFAALAFGLWYTGRASDYAAAFAFVGCFKLGLWTPYVLVVFADAFLVSTPFPLYLFLVGSHLAMVLQAFVLHRISTFRVRALVAALAWYGFNDVVDYFLTPFGTPHHTLLPGQARVGGLGGFTHPSPTHEVAAAGAVVLTLSAAVLLFSTRVAKLRSRIAGD